MPNPVFNPSTTTKTKTYQQVADIGNPEDLADFFRGIRLGTMLRRIKATIASLGATATPDITSAAVFAAATLDSKSPSPYPAFTTLPVILVPISLRVTASGTAASLGTYILSDAGGTAIVPPGGASVAVGVALLGDDQKTITFPNTVTGFVIEYLGISADLLALFERQSTQ